MKLVETVNQAQSGSLLAFDQLVVRYQDMAVAYAFGELRDFHHAQDAAQEAFIEAFRDLRQLREPSAFPGWLRRIVWKHCDRLRRVKQVATVPLEAETEFYCAMPSPAQLLEGAQLKLLVWDAIQTLPEHQRIAVLLFYIGEYSYAEIAAWMEIPLSTVKKRLYDARRHLKVTLKTMANLENVKDTLSENAPSRDTRFARSVELCAACISGDAPIAASLLDHDPTLVDCHGKVDGEHMRSINADGGWTPLHLAAHYGHLPIVRLLLDHGADTEAIAQNSIGNTPLSAASFGGRTDIVELLLERGANINAPNLSGYTALHRTAMNNHLEMARLLLAHGANPNLRSDEGKTALDLARERNHGEVAALLFAQDEAKTTI